MLGYGLGLRSVHYDYILKNWPAVDWFEAITENFLEPGGRPRAILRKLREEYPIVLHGLSFNIGSNEPIDFEYLTKLKTLRDEIQPEWISDHLCWTGIDGFTSHDLLPISYTQENLVRCATKILKIQDFLQANVVIENPTTYLQFRSSEMPEWEFINRLVEKTECNVLLDINNVFVSAFNLGFDSAEYINSLNPRAIKQFHLAGHTDNKTHLVDTHDHPVRDEVWGLYRHACQLFGPVPTLLERDDNIPDFSELLQELQLARELQNQVLTQRSRQSSATPISTSTS